MLNLEKIFTDYFILKKHFFLPSFPIIPNNDPSLLLINSGVAALKKYFLNIFTPPSSRIVLNQNCIRTIDIEKIGKTPFHLTYFVMLGNFSFNDYFKKEAIDYSWEFLTKILGNFIDKDKLFITVYKNDHETINHWLNKIKLNPKHLILREKKYNFWDVGSGPCGSCTEIYYDLGESFNGINLDKNRLGVKLLETDIPNNRYIEIWNIVFSEFNHLLDDSYVPLGFKNIDTGAGLERIYTIIQKKSSVFETNLFLPIIETCDNLLFNKFQLNFKDAFLQDNKLNTINSVIYTQELCIIADHIRTIIFLIKENVIPSNKGRGFVTRKLIKNILDISKKYYKFSKNKYFLEDFVKSIFINVQYFISLKKFEPEIIHTLKTEEEIYFKILKKSKKTFSEFLKKWKVNNQITTISVDIFNLHTTYGFGLESIYDFLRNNLPNLSDLDFRKINKEVNGLIDNHKQFSKIQIGKINPMPINSFREIISKTLDKKSKTIKKFEKSKLSTNILIALSIDLACKKIDNLIKDKKYYLIFKQSIFFPTSGGQSCDTGNIYDNNNILIATIEDVIIVDDWIIHLVTCKKSFNLRSEDKIKLSLNISRRENISRNHSATHLLHAFLKKINPTITQAGSLIDEKYFRFDYYSLKLSQDELESLELKVQKIIAKDIPKKEETKNLADILNNNKIEKNFLEKYSSKIKIVSFGKISSELCGGIHIDNLNKIKNFLIYKNFSKSIDVQRIIVFTDINYYQEKIIDDFNNFFESQIIKISKHISLLLKKNEFKKFKSKKIYKNLEKINFFISKNFNLKIIKTINSYKKLKNFWNNLNLNLKNASKEIKNYQNFILLNELDYYLSNLNNNIIILKNNWKILFFELKEKKIDLKSFSSLIFNKKDIQIIFFLQKYNETEIIKIYFDKKINLNEFMLWFKKLIKQLEINFEFNFQKIIHPVSNQVFCLFINRGYKLINNLKNMKTFIQNI